MLKYEFGILLFKRFKIKWIYRKIANENWSDKNGLAPLISVADTGYGCFACLHAYNDRKARTERIRRLLHSSSYGIVSESFQLRSGQCVHKILYKIQGSKRQIQYGKAERYVPCHILPARRTCAGSRIYDSRKSPSCIRSEADRRGNRACSKTYVYYDRHSGGQLSAERIWIKYYGQRAVHFS